MICSYYSDDFGAICSYLVVLTVLNCRRRCKRYYINGERKGSVDIFVDNLPGPPDNIWYDGEGQYWMALTTVTKLRA